MRVLAKPEQLERLRGISAQVKSITGTAGSAWLTDDLPARRAEGIHYALWYEADYPTGLCVPESRPLIVFWRGTAPARAVAHHYCRHTPSQRRDESAQLRSGQLRWLSAVGRSSAAWRAALISLRIARPSAGKATAALCLPGLRAYTLPSMLLAARLQRNGFLLSEHAPDQLVRPDWLVLRNRLIAAYAAL